MCKECGCDIDPLKIYNNYLVEIERIMGKDTETTNIELDAVGKKLFGKKYVGTFSSDRIPKLKKNQMCIANLDDSTQPGSHWVALYCNDMNRTYFYDSFGRKVNSFKNIQKRNRHLIEAKDYDAEQKIEESNCGQRCMAILSCFSTMPAKYVLQI